MTLRRSLTPALFATLAATGFCAQPSAPTAGDNLNLRYANGIVAVAEDKIITVADVSREITPLLAGIGKDARNQQDYDARVEALQDSVIQELIDRVLIIKEFKKDEKKHIPEAIVDTEIARMQSDQFDNDRSKFLAYLRSRGTTLREFRKEQEDEIIYRYMQGQQRKSQSVVSPVKIETFYNENKDRFYREDEVHLRLIQLSRGEGDTDASLLAAGNDILAKLKAGQSFEDLAKEYSKDTRKSKGGDWGWLKRSDFKKEFSDPAFALKKGECSQPVVLPEGCFLLFAEDRKFAGIQPIDEVRDQIERILVTQMSRSGTERWLERLRRNGYVKHY
ncbi:MAG: peptidylprolyl isomerase [Verrucomicrobia bacterium]|nr:peptidylprolyl isomerase [Verrucomicrobiota bacterium]